jgi:peptidyl-prolyl cis-trans isomerase B (cyclophilin B)
MAQTANLRQWLWTAALLALALALALALYKTVHFSSEELAKSLPKSELNVEPDGVTKLQAVFETSKGNFSMRFYANEAPQSVRRIVTLIEQGFYNGLSIFRKEPQFMVQFGDPKNDGSGGTGVKLPAELNIKKHVRGSVAIARAPGDPNSGDSQLYITFNAFPHLDGLNTIIARLVDGMDIVETLEVGDKILNVTLSEFQNK